MMNKRSPTEIDKAIGRKVCLARRALKISQTKLGEQIGVAYQQVQKYENGTDRVGAARVFQIAAVTDYPIGFFFEFTEEELRTSRVGVLADEGMQRLLTAATKIKSPKLLKNLNDLAKIFAKTPET